MTRGEALKILDTIPTIGEQVDALEMAIKALEQPERKTGKWIDNHTTCSECGWQMIDDVMQTPNMVGFNYCPNCGADMRGEQDVRR